VTSQHRSSTTHRTTCTFTVNACHLLQGTRKIKYKFSYWLSERHALLSFSLMSHFPQKWSNVNISFFQLLNFFYWLTA